ncbi:MAG: hypothetical protein COX39_00855 [Candidatus Nealsonbacteria bacterium CG23_combo_of_CG06-09_8_20_14_all_40_13]|uniref:Uncharacterized protein n=1 Tax=Candidatus Nealsonbacteria bacterium CG23_combo_of_CG06-09_8_20_14_all_40_13 TaxID=1974724 RepID=A0A2G9YRL4_9BACT|nr:MAG: hypothetical protein COX39_00855 [Candidatus Nealsonbacteria bacterium CG23_combo_of_CG06-09_8_20_14_all_40_13]PIR71220.1 MAG: hypothetical protein COU44_00745 [Candidatus Nealsonbacteria bacterium CG10_big_fil_rev_8_21_14_0_10_40_24]PIU43168.1 MAG: hypothetical protein COS97_02510 [Candidatus Nealsonbacteria bacterium CG07_land_8_20_14_0_80_40_10]
MITKIKSYLQLRQLTYLKIFLLLILISSLVGFWHFQPLSPLKIMSVIMALLSVYFFFVLQRYDLLILLSFYFSLFTLYNIYFSGLFYLWAQMLSILALVFIYYYFLILSLDKTSPSGNLFPYAILLSFLILEIFLVLSFWPINVESKSIIIITSFYLCWGLVSKSMLSTLTLRNSVSYLILAGLVYLISIATISWNYQL